MKKTVSLMSLIFLLTPGLADTIVFSDTLYNRNISINGSNEPTLSTESTEASSSTESTETSSSTESTEASSSTESTEASSSTESTEASSSTESTEASSSTGSNEPDRSLFYKPTLKNEQKNSSSGISNIYGDNSSLVFNGSTLANVVNQRTRVNNFTYRYSLVSFNVSVTNTSEKYSTNYKYYIPYFYALGTSFTDPTTLSGLSGTAYKWNSETNRFEYPGYESSTQVYITNGTSNFKNIKRGSTDFVDDLTAIENSDRVTIDPNGLNLYNDSYNLTIKNSYTYSADDSLLYQDLGTLSPGETKSFSFSIKFYWLPKTITGAYSQGYAFFDYLSYQISQGNVIVNHVDDAGNSLFETETMTGNVGDSYSTEPKELSGYTLKEVKGNATGVYGESDTTVTYVYSKIPAKTSNVIVNHVDDAGNSLFETETMTGNVGDSYSTGSKELSGYTLKEVKGNATGVYGESDTTVTYIYIKNPVSGAFVIVHYQDESGNEIASDDTISGNIGDSYTTIQKSIPGYTFKKMKSGSAPETGAFSEKSQEVTYVYTKNTIPGKIPPTSTKSMKINNSKNSIKSSKQLPKTGDKTSFSAIIIGSVFLALSGMIVLASHRKIKK